VQPSQGVHLMVQILEGKKKFSFWAKFPIPHRKLARTAARPRVARRTCDLSSHAPKRCPSNVAAGTFAGKGKAVDTSLASAKTQSQNAAEGREPPRLVRSTEYEKAGRKYRTFELDGKKHSVWSDQWQQAKFEGRLVWFHKDLYVVTEAT
jgi:hypothetical protein